MSPLPDVALLALLFVAMGIGPAHRKRAQQTEQMQSQNPQRCIAGSSMTQPCCFSRSVDIPGYIRAYPLSVLLQEWLLEGRENEGGCFMASFRRL